MPAKKNARLKPSSARRKRPAAKPPRPKSRARAPQMQRSACPVVGIGASAGGLDALNQFFEAMPPHSGAAFVVIQHLDPTHQSLTAELLGRHTPMSVVQVSAGMAIEPDHVYVIPPNKYLRVEDGKLRLSEPIELRGMRMPIDFFFRSLAAACKERAIGIILSGTGTDGTLSLKEIKAAGGMTLAQEPATAQHDGMPRSAIHSGSVDQVLPVAKMPDALAQYVQHFYVQQPRGETPAELERPDDLDAVVALLRARAKFDFGCYKKGTLTRRIHRRMSLRHLHQLGDYVRFLRQNPDEVSALFKDLLINVSSFFRDPPAWEALREKVVAPLVAEKDDGECIRAWTPACATGEEAYSLGMLLIEQLEAARKSCTLQVFASDVDVESLDFARAGVYPESVAAELSPERLRRFFVKGPHVYRVNKELRECVIVARQNVLTDPPFSKLDLVCCRNLMIYLEGDVQNRMLSLFHFALNEGGGLFLGGAESIGIHQDLFETVSKKWRIYRRIGVTRHDKVHVPVLVRPASERTDKRGGPTEVSPPVRLTAAAHQLLLERYSPACVIINRKYEILYFSGPTQDFLVQPSGAPTRDLLTQAREGLQTKLRGAIHAAIGQRRTITVAGVRMHRGGEVRLVRFAVEPLQGSKQTEGLLLVAFEDESKATPTRAATHRRPRKAAPDEVQQLEGELRAMREDLQSSVEELEASNEELQAANEEVMSANEELETSKEELQSLNEELSTVNSQLETKIDELEAANNDLHNLLVSTELATLFLDERFRIRRFTPTMTQLLRLIPTDVGRPITDFASPLVSERLLRDAGAVLQTGTPVEEEVRTELGRWYLRRVLPYRTEDQRIRGVVMTFLDITTRKETELQLQRLATVVRDSNDAVMVHDFAGHILAWNRGAIHLYGYSESEALAMNAELLLPPEVRAQHIQMIERIRAGETVASFDSHRVTKGNELVLVWVTATVLTDESGRPYAVALTERDLSERQAVEQRLQRLNQELEQRVAERTAEREAALQRVADARDRLQAILSNTADGIVTATERGIIESFNLAAEKMFGYTAAEAIGQPLGLLMARPYIDEHVKYIGDYLRTGEAKIIGIGREVIGKRKDGSTFPMDLRVSELKYGDQHLFIGSVRDLTERKRREAELREREQALADLSAREQRRIGAELHDQIGQILSGSAMLARGIQAKVKGPMPAVAETAERIVAQLQDGYARVRDLARGLAPVITHEQDLSLALADLAESTESVYKVHCEFHGDEIPQTWPLEKSEHLYRIAQEAVSNAVRHGHPSRVWITLVKEDKDGFALSVRDDGSGIPQNRSASRGLGLGIMRHRADLIGGELEVRPSNDDRGTVVRCTIPG